MSYQESKCRGNQLTINPVEKHIAHARTQKRVRTINMETIEKISDGLDSLDVTYDFFIKDDESEKQFLATL